MYNRNGILVQNKNLRDSSFDEYMSASNYTGVHQYKRNPLRAFVRDRECKALTHEAAWKKLDDKYSVFLNFISNESLVKRYLKKCREMNAPTRTLFIMSGFDEEIWTSPLPKMIFLGFEVCEILFDACTIYDLFFYPQYDKYVRLLNENGLFSNDRDATAFMNHYNEELAQELVGDGDVDLYVCKVFEVDEESLLA